MVDAFVGIIKKYLNIEKVEEISITKKWSECPPEEALPKPMREYLADNPTEECPAKPPHQYSAELLKKHPAKPLKEYLAKVCSSRKDRN